MSTPSAVESGAGANRPSTINVRPYKDADESQVLSLFIEQQNEGVPGAPINAALQEHSTSPHALFAYASTVVGLGLLWVRYNRNLKALFSLSRLPASNVPLVERTRDVAIPVLATLAPLISVVKFFLYRKALRGVFDGYTAMSLEMDLKDIGVYYMGFNRSVGGKGHWQQELSGDVVASRENVFWVAEDTETGQIVGIVGLDSTLDMNPGIVELRRMAVALSHRRRGIAHMLTKTLVDHVKALNRRPGADHNKITTIKLSTTRFQQNAMHMYGRHGWKKTGTMLYTQKHRFWGDWIAMSYPLTIQNMALDVTTLSEV